MFVAIHPIRRSSSSIVSFSDCPLSVAIFFFKSLFKSSLFLKETFIENLRGSYIANQKGHLFEKEFNRSFTVLENYLQFPFQIRYFDDHFSLDFLPRFKSLLQDLQLISGRQLRQAIRLLAGHFAIVEIVEAGFLN
jgi:hypothetical protein